jgi:hypothetical protein
VDQTNDMTLLANRTERLVDSITNAILATAETAAQRIELAAQVAQVNQRMAAFGAVLEAVGAQKDTLTKRLSTATGATRLLVQRQIDVLSMQELAVLEQAGVPQQTATAALKQADERKLYVREGKRFLPLDGEGPVVQTLLPGLVGSDDGCGTNGNGTHSTNGHGDAT